MRRELRIEPESCHDLRSEARDFAALGSELQARPNVVALQVRKVREDLCFRHARSKHFQNVAHADAHAANARATAALQWVECDAIDEFFG